ncbi:AAA family ATPase [Candidatus Woesearchaeota archaeon]|nr:AAA family ATPase [Candidatus Woesearchaeota archaeon]
MLIKKIKLKNIRSYIGEEIEFDKGITLLSGDIGSGKSTILLAIDFALFGLRKGYLSGNALLRNGEKEGSVELTFEIDEKEITITRNLKRTSTSIAQDYGTLKQSEKREYSAIELKDFILSKLNYPKEYLTKSKYFIYNYTIYTPQEEMKQILLGDKEYRLDTIRKVFGIDKYKRIKENSKILIDNIRLKKKELSLITDKQEEKKFEKEDKHYKIVNNINLIENLKLDLEKLKAKLLEKQNAILSLDKEIKEFNDFKKHLELKNLELSYKTRQITKNEDDTINLEKEILKLKEETKENIEFNKEIKIEKENSLKKLNEELQELKLKEREFLIKKSNSLEIIKSIEKLDICPTCKQNVTIEYKSNINSKENEIIIKLDSESAQIKDKINSITKEISDLTIILNNLARKENLIEIINLKRKSLQEKLVKIEEIKTQNLKLKEEIQKLKEETENLNKIIHSYSDLDKKYETQKRELELLNKENNDMEVKKAVLENDIQNLNREIEKINQEIEKINEAKRKLNYLTQLQSFIEGNFINILETIEKKVMLKIKNDFDSFFQKWFYMLIDSEIIKVKLDEEFSPIIEQAGHELEYVNLSGGEKTAAALAYRLALNQIINTFVSEIKTKDLLILDEPTDGFSSEQLDRLRQVFEELNTNQIIIVSHENKIESFADKIIRLQKTDHITKII